MRTWLWTLLLVVVAVALAVMLREHAGNVVLLAPPWRVELSVTLAVLLLLLAFVVLHLALRLLSWLLAIPGRVRGWRDRRAQTRDQELIEQGWIGMLEGRYAHAAKDMSKLYAQTKAANRRVLAALSAARASHHMGEYERRDQLLAAARESAEDDARRLDAVASVSADLLLDQGLADKALEILEPLRNSGARHFRAQHLLLRAEKELGHHDQVFTLARSLLRRHALERDEALALIDTAGAARLRAGMRDGDGDGWRGVWKELKSEERLLPNIALAGAAAFEAAGERDEAARVLEAAINHRFNPTLISAYSRCAAEQAPRRLAQAEVWLQRRPDDANLLTALGMLCLNGQLWGQAERYLKRSLARRNDSHCHGLLGILYDRLNRPRDAVRHWRLATESITALPELAEDAALPPADTGADPQSYLGMGLHAEADTLPSAPRIVSEPPPSDEDYFDSAPIPHPLAHPLADSLSDTTDNKG